ncbi:lipopolysaccharide biosynthesis protein [Endozoicomonas ascidiicola]|uniref:lipopolysaccharide biosynthesis protein n=1 Tax=Endozoicomonas ascidiicola TaxID=1698521 RepID=UPI000832A522|nr:hypothetical protein [Endozoicomonas ascidiicola]
MKKILNFFKIKNYKALFTTGAGVGISQLISLMSIPIIARLSGPEIFGKYSFYNSIIIVLCVFGSLKMEYVLYRIPWRLYPHLKLISFWLILINSIALSFLSFLSLFFLSEILNVDVFYSFAISIASTCLFQFTIQDNIKKNKYKKNAYMRIFRSFLIPLTYFCIVFFGETTPVHILISYSIGNIIPWVLMQSTKDFRKIKFKRIKSKNIKSMWRICYPVTMYLVPAHFLNRYSVGCLLIISGLYGIKSQDLAIYSIVEKLIVVPAGIITTAVSDVVKSEINKNPMNGLKNYYKISIYTILLSIVTILIVVNFSEYLIVYLMGSKWFGVGEFTVAILPYFVSLLVFGPITHTYTILNKQKYDFVWQIFNSILITVAVLLGLNSDFLTSVHYFSISASISLLISATICRYIIVSMPDK